MNSKWALNKSLSISVLILLNDVVNKIKMTKVDESLIANKLYVYAYTAVGLQPHFYCLKLFYGVKKGIFLYIKRHL